MVESQIGGKYRGLLWRKKNLQQALISQPFHNLQYRGVKYLGFVYSRKKNYSIKLAPELTDSKNYSPQISLEIETNEGGQSKSLPEKIPEKI